MISVVIPTYNRAQTIRMAVDSVLNQTYRDIELIIVDDASTDGTQDVVTQIADDRIRYLRLEQRSGACNARNIGALSARGEFISFQDSDDKWHLDKLEKQYQFMIDRNLDFSFCGMTRIMLEDPNRKYYYPNVDMDDNKDYFDQHIQKIFYEVYLEVQKNSRHTQQIEFKSRFKVYLNSSLTDSEVFTTGLLTEQPEYQLDFLEELAYRCSSQPLLSKH